MGDAAAAVAAIDAMIVRIHAATAEGVVAAAHLVQALAMGNAPVRTGTLRRSIYVDGPAAYGAGIYAAQVGPTVIYGRIRELGGDIHPVRAKALRWYGADGRPVFARHVHQTGRPYLKPAVEAALPAVRELMASMWGQAILM